MARKRLIEVNTPSTTKYWTVAPPTFKNYTKTPSDALVATFDGDEVYALQQLSELYKDSRRTLIVVGQEMVNTDEGQIKMRTVDDFLGRNEAIIGRFRGFKVKTSQGTNSEGQPFTRNELLITIANDDGRNVIVLDLFSTTAFQIIERAAGLDLYDQWVRIATSKGVNSYEVEEDDGTKKTVTLSYANVWDDFYVMTPEEHVLYNEAIDFFCTPVAERTAFENYDILSKYRNMYEVNRGRWNKEAHQLDLMPIGTKLEKVVVSDQGEDGRDAYNTADKSDPILTLGSVTKLKVGKQTVYTVKVGTKDLKNYQADYVTKAWELQAQVEEHRNTSFTEDGNSVMENDTSDQTPKSDPAPVSVTTDVNGDDDDELPF